MLGENPPPEVPIKGEFAGSPEAIEAGVDLESARRAYQIALEKLQKAMPGFKQDKRRLTTELKRRNVGTTIVRLPLDLVIGMIVVLRNLLREVGEMVRDVRNDVQDALNKKNRSRNLAIRRAEEETTRVQHLLLETLWARDYVQYILEQKEPVPYHIKRDALTYLIEHDDLLDDLRREVVERYDLDPAKLRKAQPTSPKAEAWWWFLDNRRSRRARRLNALWFVLATVPALAAIVLITLLTQRLSIDGPDALSGASAIAQALLGLASILAGREVLNAFFFDRSSGRSWQGEATFALATLFFVVVMMFYLVAPPAAADVYNWFGQRAIDSGNAAEAELYLESATRLDPDPHASNLLEVGCLYLTLGSPDRAESVFERVLEADSRLLLARYYLAELNSDNGEYDKALQLLTDGLNLLASARANPNTENDILQPYIEDPVVAEQIEYLLHLSLGRAYLEAGTYQQAKANLSSAQASLGTFDLPNVNGPVPLPCAPDERLHAYVATTEIDLWYFEARVFDAICSGAADSQAALSAWNEVRLGRTTSSRQDTHQDEAEVRLARDSALGRTPTCLDLESNTTSPFGGG
ncbi:MAG: tetratricopeptide repeat protein [Chloroflexi bacterium]|nr:tetratricopeptide repeat protein [Chloroflexota bacterium]